MNSLAWLRKQVNMPLEVTEKVEAIETPTTSTNGSFHAKELFDECDELSRIRIVRRPHPPIIIHQITDAELKGLQEGTPEPIYFSVALSLCLSAFSIVASLLLPHKSFLWVCAALLFGAGIMSGIVWLRRYQLQRLKYPGQKTE